MVKGRKNQLNFFSRKLIFRKCVHMLHQSKFLLFALFLRQKQHAFLNPFSCLPREQNKSMHVHFFPNRSKDEKSAKISFLENGFFFVGQKVHAPQSSPVLGLLSLGKYNTVKQRPLTTCCRPQIVAAQKRTFKQQPRRPIEEIRYLIMP